MSNVAVLQEHPPSRIAAVIKAADGTSIGRWAEDESSVENILGNATKTGDMPGGHTESSQVLARDPNQSYPDLALFSRLEWQGAGGEVLWSGGIRQEPQSSGDRTSIEVKALGDKQFLEDDEDAIGPAFINCDQSSWGEPSAQRRIDLINNSELLSATQATQGLSGSEQAALLIQILEKRAGSVSEGEFWFNGGSVDLRKVLFDFIVPKAGGDPGGQHKTVHRCENDRTSGQVSSKDFSVTAAERQELATSEPGKRYAYFQSKYSGAAEGTFGGDAYGLANVKLLGVAGAALALQGEWPNVGFTAKQMLPFIADLAGLTTIDELLEDDEFVIPQAWFSAPGTPMSKLIEVTKYGLLDWFVFQHQLLQYRFPGTYGRKWRLASGASAPKNSGPDAMRVWDGAMGTYQEVDGTTKTVGAPGSGAMFEDTNLQITDPRNAAVAAGRPRRKLVAPNGTLTSKLAIQTVARFLEEATNLDQSGEATISGYSQDQYGIWWPAAYVQPGDWAADPGTQNYRKITNVSYAHDSKTANVSLGAPPQGLEALEARFNAQLIELGF
jgi:hypothetical protein